VANEAHLSGIAGRYALAVFELAQETKSVDAVQRDLQALKTMLAESADLARLVRAPVFAREAQAKGMQGVLAAAGADQLTVRFVLLLCSKRRLFLLPQIITGFNTLVERDNGEIEAEVTSARTLTGPQTEELKRVLKGSLGRDPLLKTQVDPGLLGGLVVKIGSRMIDSSLRTKLNGIRLAMRGSAH
jgi:F-type H+-transporting ATPase subunit delta